MEPFISDYEIPLLERRAGSGDREAAERLIRFYDSEIAWMTANRDRLRAAMAESAATDEA